MLLPRLAGADESGGRHHCHTDREYLTVVTSILKGTVCDQYPILSQLPSHGVEPMGVGWIE